MYFKEWGSLHVFLFTQAVVDAILAELGQVAKAIVAEMETDLCKLINKHPYIQVRAAQAKSPGHDDPSCFPQVSSHTGVSLCRWATCCTASSTLFPVIKELPDRRVGTHLCNQVVSAACRALASLARGAPTAAAILTANAQNYLAALRNSQSSDSSSVYCPRCCLRPG